MDLRRSPAAATSAAVDHLLQHPGAAAGGVLLFPGRLIRRAHHPPVAPWCRPGTCRHPCTGARPAEIAAVVRVGQRRAVAPRAAARRARRRSASSGSGATITPGFSTPSGSKACLTAAEQRQRRRASTSAAAVRCGPGRRRARRTATRRTRPPGRPRRPGTPRSTAGRRAGPAGSPAAVHAAVAEVAVRACRSRPCSRQQRVEIAQVGAERAGGTAASSQPG